MIGHQFDHRTPVRLGAEPRDELRVHGLERFGHHRRQDRVLAVAVPHDEVLGLDLRVLLKLLDQGQAVGKAGVEGVDSRRLPQHRRGQIVAAALHLHQSQQQPRLTPGRQLLDRLAKQPPRGVVLPERREKPPRFGPRQRRARRRGVPGREGRGHFAVVVPKGGRRRSQGHRGTQSGVAIQQTVEQFRRPVGIVMHQPHLRQQQGGQRMAGSQGHEVGSRPGDAVEVELPQGEPAESVPGASGPRVQREGRVVGVHRRAAAVLLQQQVAFGHERRPVEPVDLLVHPRKQADDVLPGARRRAGQRRGQMPPAGEFHQIPRTRLVLSRCHEAGGPGRQLLEHRQRLGVPAEVGQRLGVHPQHRQRCLVGGGVDVGRADDRQSLAHAAGSPQHIRPQPRGHRRISHRGIGRVESFGREHGRQHRLRRRRSRPLPVEDLQPASLGVGEPRRVDGLADFGGEIKGFGDQRALPGRGLRLGGGGGGSSGERGRRARARRGGGEREERDAGDGGAAADSRRQA